METNWIIRLRLEDSGREFTSAKTRIIIGRNMDCELSFPGNNTISRYHAEIFCRGGKWYIIDRGSVNGTWVGKEQVTAGKEIELSAGDVIDLAHKLRIVFVEGKTQEPDRVVTPVEAAPVLQFCRVCGMPVKGRFCANCGSLVDTAQSMPCPVAPRVAPPAPMAAQPAPMPVRPASMAAQPAPMPVRPAPMAAQPAPMPARPAPKAAKAQKKGLFSKLGSIFEGKSSESSAPAPAAKPVPAPATVDDVQFRGTAPETIRPGEYFPVKIMMYREDDYQRADRESAAVADRTKSASSSVFQATRGQQFRITLQSPDIQLDCETQQLRWNGKFAAADFEVYLPENYDRRQLRLRGRVYSDNAVLTDLKLILQIGAEQPQSVVCEKVRLRSAFISYASADRAKVVARIQGIQLACPDMDLFFDAESLRRGEHWESRLYQEIAQRDLFYLFWSQNAAASDWVQKELRYAMAQKTADYIEPIPLEGPESCPPPQCLMDKHFNDWTLRYLNNQ